jgi:hypothetical protein
MKDYSCSVIIDPGIVVRIVSTGNIDISSDGEQQIKPEEFAAISIISEVLSRLRNGKMIEYKFDGDSFDNEAVYYKCEWLRSGNLKVHGPTDRRSASILKLCETVESALQQRRSFVCPKYLVELIPKKRKKLYKPDTQQPQQ